jgi:tungstate transport system substrate-binding protein
MRSRLLAIAGALSAVFALTLPLATPAGGADAEAAGDPVLFAVGTTAFDTGLLDALLPPFEARTGIRVRVFPVGTGQALTLAGRGEADLVLAHSPPVEEEFMARGGGVVRRQLMVNDFIVVGPASDKAAVRRCGSGREAFAAIARSGAAFVSRGDESGTHLLEKRLWTAAESKPAAGAYVETGQGQAATLRVASEKQSYALTDRGTFIALRKLLQLDILHDGDPGLRNVYHLIVTNPRNGARVNVGGAQTLARYLLSPETLAVLRDFGRKEFGQPLFIPDAEPYGGD